MLFAHLTDDQVVDVKIGLAFLFLLFVLRVVVWAWDTRFDFERSKRHGEALPYRERNSYEKS